MKSALTVAVTITAGIVLSGCSLAQRSMPGSTMSNADILGLLNTINRSDIDAGQLAEQTASTQEVRSFASRMVSEHQMMVQKIDQLAPRLSVQPQKPALASTMENTHQETMEELRTKSGLGL
jgi:predicted outer membrane protein